MTVVSTVAVILRLLGRRVSAAEYGVDDFLIVVALVLTYGLNVNELIAVHFGFGRHQLMLSLDHISKFLLNDWTIQIIFACAITVTRFSLLVFYHRIFPVKRFTIVAIITGCILLAWWIGFIFAILFSCRPIESFWNKALIDHCVNEHTLSWGVTGSELATNVMMLVLPIPWLWDLRLACTKKLALIGLFMLGCLLVESSILLLVSNKFTVYAFHVLFGSHCLLSSDRQMPHVSIQVIGHKTRPPADTTRDSRPGRRLDCRRMQHRHSERLPPPNAAPHLARSIHSHRLLSLQQIPPDGFPLHRRRSEQQWPTFFRQTLQRKALRWRLSGFSSPRAQVPTYQPMSKPSVKAWSWAWSSRCANSSIQDRKLYP